MQDYRRLRVWERAHALTLEVYGATRRMPRRGNAHLVAQIQRAALSISANIAEGCGREGPRDLAKFLQIAMASAHELEYHLLLTMDLGLLPVSKHATLSASVTAVKKMLAVLIRRVRESEREGVGGRPGAAVPSTGHSEQSTVHSVS